jgi:maltokinase
VSSATVADALPGLLVEHLPAHLRRQRWSGAHNRPIDRVELAWHETVRAESPWLIWALAHVHFADGAEQDFQVFVGARPVAPPPDFLQGKEVQLVAVAPNPEGGDELVLYDALIDPDLAIEVLHLAAPDLHVEVRRPIVLEHSNSSIVFDESSILKVFRKVDPGPNPDVEIPRELAAHGFEHVLPPLAELRRGDTDLAVLREYLASATEGWALARTSLRDALASRLHPSECGGDFSNDAERLGSILGELHLTMAAAFGGRPGDAASWTGEMQDHLASLGGDDEALSSLDRDAVVQRFATLAEQADVGAEIRIHGDLHLAQMIQSDVGWVVLDFEGEPGRDRADRYTTSSPLRDVAGMLRSFHYVAAVGRADWADEDGELDQLAGEWEARNRAAFLTGYLGVEGIADLLPASTEDRDGVLAAFELDKAVYEVAYELSYRPDQVGVPLAGIARIVAAASAP